MTESEALVALNMAGKIGTKRLNRLLNFFIKPQNIFSASQEKLTDLGINEKDAHSISSFDFSFLDKEISSAKKSGLKIITLCDAEYPERLKNIPGAPIVLYIKGVMMPEDSSAIAVVGSRRASFYGLTKAFEFGLKLASLGFTVISGLARGIDTQSHQGALKSEGRTIAVIGSGFNNLYPAENLELAQEISRRGCVISEFPLEEKPLACNFPRRNRLISGLSLGVLVVEASNNSGALITANFALEQGREVFAVPGKIDSPNSSGTNQLIKEGAKMVTGIEDILEEFSALKNPGPQKNSYEKEQVKSDTLEGKLQFFITDRSVQLDELVDKTGADLPSVYRALFNLLINGQIKQLAGKHFVRHC